MTATGGGEEERRVQPRKNLGDRERGPGGQRDGPQRPRLLAVQLHLPICVDAADTEDAGLSVDVAAFERDPFLRPEARERPDDRHGAEAGAELNRDGLDVVDRLERGNLPPLRLRVGDAAAGFSSSSFARTA